MAEMLASSYEGRPATIAMCPHSQLLAVVPKAGRGDGGSSRVEFVRVSKQIYGRRKFLEPLGSNRVADGGLHRLAWSWNSDSSAYRAGLLAGGFDGGVVSIWNPDDKPWCSPVSSSCFFDLPRVNNPTDVKLKKIVSDMSREVERIYMNQLDETVGGWHIVEENCNAEGDDWELVNMRPAALLQHKSSGERADLKGPALLKIADLEGPVLGLGFNSQYPNMLAAAGKADKLNIYHIDYPVRDSTSKYEFADGSDKVKNARVTWLEWHPHYPHMLASTSDAGITTMWDIRGKKPVLRFEDKNQHCTEVHWSPVNPLQLAVSSIGRSSDTVKIWDLGNTENNYLNLNRPVEQFGPKRGVTTLSWSAAHDLILTTDVGGGIDCWTVDGKERVELSGVVPSSLEARWRETEHEFVVSTTTGVELYKLLRPPVAI